MLFLGTTMNLNARQLEFKSIHNLPERFQEYMWKQFNMPVPALEVKRRMHLARMTLCVYELDVEEFKKKLASEMQSRGATVSYVVNTPGFVRNTSIRVPVESDQDELWGKDQLTLKTSADLCDEILASSTAKHYEILFQTSQEIKGYGDQMLYWRWI